MIATPLKKIRIKVINLPPPQTPKKKKRKGKPVGTAKKIPSLTAEIKHNGEL